MANARSPTLENVLSTVPEHQRHKLEEKIDCNLRHIGLIASKFSMWDGRVADELKLTAVEVYDIKNGRNRDCLEMQRCEALQKWVSKDSKGTFRALIEVFHRAGYADYCDKVIEVMCEDQLPHSRSIDVKILEQLLESVIRWDMLGKWLGISDHQIKNIREKFSADGIDAKKSEMFQIWLKNGRDVTWEKLCEALEGIHRESLAEEIRNEYCH